MLYCQVIIVHNSEEFALPKSRKTVFFFPLFASSDTTAPLGILAFATPPIRAGYEIVLIDSTITPDYRKRVLEEVSDALCLGISYRRAWISAHGQYSANVVSSGLRRRYPWRRPSVSQA
jgi:hypothetical protein